MDVGSAVKNFKIGDRVVAPFTTSWYGRVGVLNVFIPCGWLLNC